METSGTTTTDTAPAPAATAAPTPAADTSAPATPAPAAAPAASTDTPAAPATEVKTEPSTPPAGAPEKYEFTPTEGIKLDESVIGKFSEVAKSLNLPQEGAQKIISEVAPLIAKQQADAFKATVDGWASAAKADTDIGGEKFAENLALAKRGIEAHFSKDFVALLDATGLGNHPEMIRGMMKIGRSVSQDTFIPGGSGASNQGKSAADVLYGSSN